MILPQPLIDWCEDQYVTENMTPEEAGAVHFEQCNRKITSYELISSVRTKLLNGTYTVPDGLTVDSIMHKQDSSSTSIYDAYLQEELNLAVANDPELDRYK